MKAAPVIITIDDEAVNTLLIESHLKSKGYDIITLNDSTLAMKLIIEKNPDLILLDIMMPEVDGLVLLNLIRQNRITRNIPVIMVSGSTSEYYRIESKRLGAISFIEKPVDLAIMEKEIKKALEK